MARARRSQADKLLTDFSNTIAFYDSNGLTLAEKIC